MKDRAGWLSSDGYWMIKTRNDSRARKDGYRREHLVIAEAALGKQLPKTAKVHHHNEIKTDNQNCNLVICEDDAYHLLLHARMRALRACGNPDYRCCIFCKQWDSPDNLMIGAGVRPGSCIRHRKCASEYERKRYHQIQVSEILTCE